MKLGSIIGSTLPGSNALNCEAHSERVHMCLRACMASVCLCVYVSLCAYMCICVRMRVIVLRVCASVFLHTCAEWRIMLPYIR